MSRPVPEHLRRGIVATGTIALIAAPLWSHAIATPAAAATPTTDTRSLDLRIAAEGGALQLIDASNMVRIGALASKTRTGMTTFLRAGKTFTGANDDGLRVFQARNLGEIAVAELKAMVAQDGQLVLTNEAGDRLVVAGVSTKGVGVIKMGPAGNGAAAVMGNMGLPASEIQGKKN